MEGFEFVRVTEFAELLLGPLQTAFDGLRSFRHAIFDTMVENLPDNDAEMASDSPDGLGITQPGQKSRLSCPRVAQRAMGTPSGTSDLQVYQGVEPPAPPEFLICNCVTKSRNPVALGLGRLQIRDSSPPIMGPGRARSCAWADERNDKSAGTNCAGYGRQPGDRACMCSGAGSSRGNGGAGGAECGKTGRGSGGD